MKIARSNLRNVLPSLLGIFFGLLTGFWVLLFSDPFNAFDALWIILKGGANAGMKGMGQVLYQATPIIMTGLSVGFAFKTGLFNIGAPGQLMVGGFAAIYVGVMCPMPAPWHWMMALLCGIVAGGLWGMLPGWFKAYLNVNEVLSSIMMNYIGLYGTRYLIKANPALYDQMRNQTVNVLDTAVIPKGGLDHIFYSMIGDYKDISAVNAGIYIAIAIAVICYIVLNATTFGYELRACGHNRDAARYAGVNERRIVMRGMLIAGALAGAAGAMMYLAPSSGMHMHVDEIMPSQGFGGISVALLALSNPVGIVLCALFIGHITIGASYLQSLGFMPEVIDIIIGLIIYFSAFAPATKRVIERIRTAFLAATEPEKEDE